MRVFRSYLYRRWHEGLTEKEKRIIDTRIDVAREFGVFKKYKLLDKNYSLYEFKWDCGLRAYFSILKDKNGNFILLLTGGNKNSQSRDITDSKNLIGKATKSIRRKREGNNE